MTQAFYEWLTTQGTKEAYNDLVLEVGGGGDFNSSLLAIANTQAGTSKVALNDALQAWAVSLGYTTFNDIDVFPTDTPLTIFGSDTLLWSDSSNAASITSSGGRVSQWDDLSGNLNHWTQGTGANQPFTGVNTQNGKNVINFDKSAAIYFETPSIQLNDYEAFFIVKDTNTYPTSSNRISFLMVHDSGGVEVLTQFSYGGGSTTQPQFRTELASSETQYIDGVLTTDPVNLNADQMYNFNVSETGGYNKNAKIGLGARLNDLTPSNNALCDLAEIVIVNTTTTTPITAQQRADFQAYVENKWLYSVGGVHSPALHLDASVASSITEVSGAVSQWDDLSGFGRHATQGTGSAQPTTDSITMNGLNAISFDGGNYFLDYDGSFLVSKNYTIFIVGQRNGSSGNNYILGGTVGSTNQNLHFGWPTGTLFRYDQWGNSVSQTVSGYTTPTPLLLSCGIRSADRFAKYDGVESTGGSTTQLSAYVGSNIGSFNGSLFGDTDVGEIVMFDRELTSQEITDVETYLTDKWGL